MTSKLPDRVLTALFAFFLPYHSSGLVDVGVAAGVAVSDLAVEVVPLVEVAVEAVLLLVLLVGVVLPVHQPSFLLITCLRVHLSSYAATNM